MYHGIYHNQVIHLLKCKIKEKRWFLDMITFKPYEEMQPKSFVSLKSFHQIPSSFLNITFYRLDCKLRMKSQKFKQGFYVRNGVFFSLFPCKVVWPRRRKNERFLVNFFKLKAKNGLGQSQNSMALLTNGTPRVNSPNTKISNQPLIIP